MKVARVILAMAAGLVCSAAQPGLDAPAAIGPYLDGVFPTTTPGQTGAWGIVDAMPAVTFVDPVRMVKDPLAADHVYVVCRSGEVWRVPFSPTTTNAQKVRVLDLRAKTWGFWDSGMMSIAFHPDFGVPGNPNRGYVYVFYQYLPGGPVPTSVTAPSYIRVSRFTVPDGQVVFDPSSEFVLIQQFDRHNWHNGGQMFFGPDRFLHVVIGDEGDANDSYNVGQRINSRLFGGILRLDVDNDPQRSHPIRRQPQQITMPAGWQQSFTQGYSIPKDNPWLDPNGGVLEEFWCIGTRSPHSMHFDSASGEVWIADVGQGTREEISIAVKGGNLQWPYREGSVNGPKAKPASLIGADVPPVFDYGRTMGGCVIGGVVYRGTAHAGALTGKYIFGDHNTKAVYALERRPGMAAVVTYLTSVTRSGQTKSGLAGICEGPDGEVYFMELGNTGTDTGKIFRLVRNGTAVPDPPALLSQTGAFPDLATLTPRQGLMPYEVNSPLWSDGAEKRRWVAIPNDGTHNSAAEQVVFRANGAWDFPKGTVLVKHFELPVDERDPQIVAPVETRFFVHGSDGVYYGVTYRWNEQGTDAYLINQAESREFPVITRDGGVRVQQWDFPGRPDCRTCHTTAADNVLGLRAHQMARSARYPATGRQADQLETWAHLGIFGSSFPGSGIADIARAVDPMDPHESLDSRVRSYLDANCSHCHHPQGVAANFDARMQTPLGLQGLINGVVNRPFQSPDERVVKPGDVAISLLHTRASTVGAGQMPPLAKNVVDRQAMDLVADWIAALDPQLVTTGGGSGLDAEYYEDRNFESLVSRRVDAAVDFDWGPGSPGPGIPADGFSVRWKGRLVAPASGVFTLFATTDDGVRLKVNGATILNHWQDQGPAERSATVSLTSGQGVPFEMEYYENSGGAVARLSWSGPGVTKAVIPATAFRREDGPPLAGNDLFAVARGGETRLDVLANDRASGGPPGIHGVSVVSPPAHGTIRISGAEKRLVYSHDGSGARSDSFTYRLADAAGRVSDAATVTVEVEQEFGSWLANTPGAGGGVMSNGDGDLSPDLLEFALGGDPADGGAPGSGAIQLVEEGGTIGMRVIRPSGLLGIRMFVEVSGDLADWQASDAVEATPAAGGWEVAMFGGLQGLSGVTASRGFARLVVELTSTGERVESPTFGWLAVEFGAVPRTFGMPFRGIPVFASTVKLVAGNSLGVWGMPQPPQNAAGYIEVVDGPFAGHRFDVAGVEPGWIHLAAAGMRTLSTTPDLSGSTVVFCIHHTIGGMFPKEMFRGSTNPALADQLQFYQNDAAGTGFELYYLLDARPGNQVHQWRAFLPGGGDRATRVIRPGEGVLVKRAAGVTSSRILYSGHIRDHRYVMPLRPGFQLVGGVYPLPMTPRQAGLLDPASGFRASTNIGTADQFHLYQGGGFRIFYLLDHPTLADQWREAVPGSPVFNDVPLFQPGEAVFLKRWQAAPGHSFEGP